MMKNKKLAALLGVLLVKLDKAGTYQLKLSIESPASKGWMLHVDPETGVKNHQFWTEPIEVTFDNWDYTPRQW